MENISLYTQTVEECGELRRHINDDLWKDGINILKKLSSLVMDKKFFGFLHQLNYYTGGKPNVTSPPRLDEFLDKFVVLIKYYELMGNLDEVSSYLNRSGIEIKSTSPLVDEELEISPEDISSDWWNELFGDFKKDITMSSYLSKLLEKSYRIQEEICSSANVIKKEKAKEIKEKCGIKKPHFIKVVSAKAKMLKKDKSGEKQVKLDVREDVFNYDDATSIFEE